jgi:nucleoside-diphosphate-sugar epimerase
VKCLVSGATGFIGRHLCQQLADRGDTVIALSRSGSPLPDGTPTLARDLAAGDLEPGLLQGVEVVFHLAGIAHQQAGPDAYRQVNHLATLALARTAEAAGVRCFLFLSSVKAMGPSPGEAERSEQDCLPPGDPYGRSKWQAECGLREELANSAMSVVILRPTLVYGAGAKGNLQLLAKAVRFGLPRPPARGGRSMIACEDLVALLLCLADHPPRGVHTWIVCDGQRYTSRYLHDLLRRSMGRGVGTAWLPAWAWRLGTSLLDRLRSGPGEPTWDKLFGTELYSNQAVLAATGWRPTLTLEASLGGQAGDTGK